MENIYYQNKIYYFDKLTKEIVSHETGDPIDGILNKKILYLGKFQGKVANELQDLFKQNESEENKEEKIKICNLIFDKLFTVKPILQLYPKLKETTLNKLKDLEIQGYKKSSYYRGLLFNN